MSEFNPTKQDLINVERTILELKEQKAEIVGRKQNGELELAEIKEKLKDRINEELSRQKMEKKNELTLIEQEIKEVNQKIKVKREMANEIQGHLSAALLDEPTKAKIEDLKTKWKDFAADHTRIASMRLMASSFVKDLDSILKK